MNNKKPNNDNKTTKYRTEMNDPPLSLANLENLLGNERQFCEDDGNVVAPAQKPQMCRFFATVFRRFFFKSTGKAERECDRRRRETLCRERESERTCVQAARKDFLPPLQKCAQEKTRGAARQVAPCPAFFFFSFALFFYCLQLHF